MTDSDGGMYKAVPPFNCIECGAPQLGRMVLRMACPAVAKCSACGRTVYPQYPEMSAYGTRRRRWPTRLWWAWMAVFMFAVIGVVSVVGLLLRILFL